MGLFELELVLAKMPSGLFISQHNIVMTKTDLHKRKTYGIRTKYI